MVTKMASGKKAATKKTTGKETTLRGPYWRVPRSQDFFETFDLALDWFSLS